MGELSLFNENQEPLFNIDIDPIDMSAVTALLTVAQVAPDHVLGPLEQQAIHRFGRKFAKAGFQAGIEAGAINDDTIQRAIEAAGDDPLVFEKLKELGVDVTVFEQNTETGEIRKLGPKSDDDPITVEEVAKALGGGTSRPGASPMEQELDKLLAEAAAKADESEEIVKDAAKDADDAEQALEDLKGNPDEETKDSDASGDD